MAVTKSKKNKEEAVVSTPASTTKRASIPAYKRILNKLQTIGTIMPFEESMVAKPRTWLESELLGANWVLGQGIPFGCLWEVSGQESSSKAVPLSTPVLTPRGWVRMGDIKVGDEVCDPDGGIQLVEDVTYRGVRPVYKVSFSDGTHTYCDMEHLWKVRVVSKDKPWQVISLEEILHRGIRAGHRSKDKRKRTTNTYKWEIPLVSGGLTFMPKEYEVHPYILGVLLGDGILTTDEIAFSTSTYRKECVERVSKLLPSRYRVKQVATCGGILSVIDEMPTFADKPTSYAKYIKNLHLDVLPEHTFIPEEYLWGSYEQRMDLLAGLMDTDSGVFSGKAGASFKTKSKQLAENVIYLVKSLGGMAVLSGNRDKLTGASEWLVQVMLPFNPFSVPYKAVRYLVRKDLHKCISNIERVEDAEVQCIRVSGSSGTYVLNDFIVTHNSSFSYALSGSLQKTHNALVMIYDTERMDSSMAKRTGLVPELTAIATPDAKASIPNIVNDMMEKILLIEEDREKGSYDEDEPAPVIIIWDSIAATPTQTIKQAMSNKREGVKVGIVTEQMSATAAQLTTALKTLHPAIVNNNILAIFINQMRDTIQTMPSWGGPTEHTGGGRALKHAANVRLKTRYENMYKSFNDSGKKDITEGNQHVGITFTLEAIKNKLAAPFKKTEFVNMFGSGIDILQSNILHALYDLMEAQVIPLPVGGYFRINAGGTEKKYRYGQVVDYYRTDPIAYQELCEHIKAAQIELNQAVSADEVADLQRQAMALEAQEEAAVSGYEEEGMPVVPDSDEEFPLDESY